MRKTIPTVKRARWHYPEATWQVQNDTGTVWCTDGELPPSPELGRWIHRGARGWLGGPDGIPPRDYKTTLRRIIDRTLTKAERAAEKREAAKAAAEAKAKQEAEAKAKADREARRAALPIPGKAFLAYLDANPDAFGCQRRHVVATVGAILGVDLADL